MYRRKLLVVVGRGVEFCGSCLCRRGIPGTLPAPGAVLGGFEVGGLAVGDPFWAALEVGAEEIADAVGMFEAADVDGECGEDLENAVEEDPAAETGFAGCGVFEVGGHFELFEFVDKR
jgi:hypothetical protein